MSSGFLDGVHESSFVSSGIFHFFTSSVPHELVLAFQFLLRHPSKKSSLKVQTQRKVASK